MSYKKLTCFKAYDLRGKVGDNFDSSVVYRVSRALSDHLNAKKIIIGYDARKTSLSFAQSAANGVTDSGSDSLMLGLSGTEEMYWAVTEFGACGGIQITGSHNPVAFNGMKIVKNGSKPLDTTSDFLKIKELAEEGKWLEKEKKGLIQEISIRAREKYVKKILSFINLEGIGDLKILVNCGNGAAGPTFNVIENRLKGIGKSLRFVHIFNEPDHNFPNGVPNPLLKENQGVTSKAVLNKKADLGVAFDGDFDRCFFFDENGRFVPGEYIIGLLAESFIEKEPGAKIVHDSRVIWNTIDVVKKFGGEPLSSKTGHAFLKSTMRYNNAVYGGEISAHHYFRDFAYCDSGMIPFLLILELISKRNEPFSKILNDRFERFPSSGEINFTVKNADEVINNIITTYKSGKLDETDGVSIAFDKWRFNLRKSNTENLLRLNVETRASHYLLQKKVDEISSLIYSNAI